MYMEVMVLLYSQTDPTTKMVEDGDRQMPLAPALGMH